MVSGCPTKKAKCVYCGPLRLLAWEVAKRLNKANVPCDLITGQEKEVVDGARHKAVIVEMADVSSNYECAVIDEIQMIGCRSRGFSFTRALLGIPADELHLCGKKIEDDGRHLCSVVYGSLPPETRTRQATMFNDESSEFDVLVASDAIGMGLNLNISRIIFSEMEKFDGLEMQPLTVPEIKQIAEFVENAKLSAKYFIANCEELLKIAAVLDELPISLHDKYLFCISPADMSDEILSQGLTQFAQTYAKNRIVRLKEIFTPGTLKVPKTQAELKELESIHKVLELYVWLSFRLDDSFPDRDLAASQKSICGMLIEDFLERLGF
ncbi:hypothetical protein L1987_62970 [Smallanthus sonchifolius]|uniref:Uncharacterized protein n=1 Tax=Smallanthus sonchifolius TaxID=185202 RepID=A0ACB9CC05_9ASTR|nr:hypothetical protein L1987_62970 [Smallanthus sonchifolius]